MSGKTLKAVLALIKIQYQTYKAINNIGVKYRLILSVIVLCFCSTVFWNIITPAALNSFERRFAKLPFLSSSQFVSLRQKLYLRMLYNGHCFSVNKTIVYLCFSDSNIPSTENEFLVSNQQSIPFSTS
jgi:hypothetical protein